MGPVRERPNDEVHRGIGIGKRLANMDGPALQFGDHRAAHDEQRRGLGAALRTSLPAARYPLIFYTTCDHQFEPAELQRALELLRASSRGSEASSRRVRPRVRCR